MERYSISKFNILALNIALILKKPAKHTEKNSILIVWKKFSASFSNFCSTQNLISPPYFNLEDMIGVCL